jgi:hypothetical protein
MYVWGRKKLEARSKLMRILAIFMVALLVSQACASECDYEVMPPPSSILIIRVDAVHKEWWSG